MNTKAYWLLKTEPDTYSFQQLLQDQTTNWNGIRNFQARNYLKLLKRGDLVLIYHSGKERAVIGIARVIKESYPDLDPNHPGDWVQVDLEQVKSLKHPVTLATIKEHPKLSKIPLLRQSRLSVMPIQSEEYETLIELSQQFKKGDVQ